MLKARSEDDWLRLHAAVLFETDPAGRLVALNEPDPEGPAPRVFVARGRTGALAWFRGDVPRRTLEVCEERVRALPEWSGERPEPEIYDGLREVLGPAGDAAEESGGPAFRFPDRSTAIDVGESVLVDDSNAELLARHFPYTRSVLPARAPVVAIVRDGAAVAVCYSARRSGDACEAGVDTIEAYRGRGFALAVVARWRAAVEAMATTPLYSTSWDNTASRRVASKLGLIAYADTLSLF